MFMKNIRTHASLSTRLIVGSLFMIATSSFNASSAMQSPHPAGQPTQQAASPKSAVKTSNADKEKCIKSDCKDPICFPNFLCSPCCSKKWKTKEDRKKCRDTCKEATKQGKK
jgi:hypothetical protein